MGELLGQKLTRRNHKGDQKESDMSSNRQTSDIFNQRSVIQEQEMPKPNIAENKHASDIFHLGDSHQLPKTPAGKRQMQGQKDNDIWGIRERTTGEKTEQKQTLLQVTPSKKSP